MLLIALILALLSFHGCDGGNVVITWSNHGRVPQSLIFQTYNTAFIEDLGPNQQSLETDKYKNILRSLKLVRIKWGNGDELAWFADRREGLHGKKPLEINFVTKWK